MRCSSQVFQMRVRIAGREIQEYRGQGGETFVEGRSGSRFEIVLKNLVGRRLLVHPMIDGISAMTGKDANRNDSEHGYVLGPYQEMVIPGWRLDDKQVAEFFFAGKGNSYAEKTGRPENRGVIACPVWEERMCETWITLPDSPPSPWILPYNPYDKPHPWISEVTYTNHTDYMNAAVDAVSAKDNPESSVMCCNNLGTGFGEAKAHTVTNVTFYPAQIEPDVVALIYYDDATGLAKRGIRVNKNKKQKNQSLPNPFPTTGCQPPAGWKRTE